MMDGRKFRLVTRSDFDGLVCAVLLRELDMIDDIKFVHPKDMQDGAVALGPNDITTNLPYVDGVHLAFDHHLSETMRVGARDNHVIDPKAPSAARVVFDHYGGADRFVRISSDMMAAVDQADSADYGIDDILNPVGWTLLNFLMDPRTGLGRFRDFRISNYQLMMELIERCRDHDIAGILALPDVTERVELYFAQEELFRQQVGRIAAVHDDLIVLDLRGEETIHAGNRFMVYALYPRCRVSMHVLWGLKQQNTVFSVGKSILDRGSPIMVGPLMLEYGGGGHAAAGTCQVDNDRAEAVKAELIARISTPIQTS
ncbi:exopolyphosphatase [Skermanella stibiiresistens SB22]|uniref:Exopolyphosphatase n=1 Tax=Skermanella stibiiresistens SB22 TaxID=1385369 RepID=W9H8R8_9PROT|nr:exopolyphosphatase [Skermanella stibiiresistens]EWY40193.1 exopolyphosphatase [Skermanella stibiiresistens SB22]